MIRNNRVSPNATFDDDTWNFMDVLDVQNSNYEYYNDIRDIEFDKKKPLVASDIFALAALMAIIALSGVILILVTGVFKDDGYSEVLAMKSVQQSNVTTYVSGEEVSSEELLSISSLLSSYFQVLASEQGYDALDAYCTGSSSFADTFNANTAKVVTLYDSSDCYARALSRFAMYCRCDEVTKVIKDNDTYYCYFNFRYPNTTDIQGYVHSNSYYLTKYFQGKDITEENIMRCFLEMTGNNGLGYHSEEYCVKLINLGEDFALINDSFMVDVCSNAYSEYLKQCSAYLGGSQIKK